MAFEQFNFWMKRIANRIKLLSNISEEAELNLELMDGLLQNLQNSQTSQNTITIKSTRPSSDSTSISFTGLSRQPKMFMIHQEGQVSLSTLIFASSIIYDGNTTYGIYIYHGTSSGFNYYSDSYFEWEYDNDNGILTVNINSTNNNIYFSKSVPYKLIYIT